MEKPSNKQKAYQVSSFFRCKEDAKVFEGKNSNCTNARLKFISCIGNEYGSKGSNHIRQERRRRKV